MTRTAKEVALLFFALVTLGLVALAQPAFSSPTEAVDEDCVQTHSSQDGEEEEHYEWGQD